MMLVAANTDLKYLSNRVQHCAMLIQNTYLVKNLPYEEHIEEYIYFGLLLEAKPGREKILKFSF